jgi:hypothetical protein
MRVPSLVRSALILLPAIAAQPAWGQTRDQARLVFTVGAGVVLGKPLWSVGAQPLQFVSGPADTLALGRRIRSTLAVGFSGTYFHGEHLGLGVDALLLGIGFEDSCRMVFSSGSSDVVEACQEIQGKNKTASAVGVSVGPVFRINSRSLFSPYARANVGVIFSSQSSIRTVGQFLTSGGFSDLIVYDDDHQSRVEPLLALGLGATAAVSPGYQLRWEVRDNISGVQRVTAASPEARVVPPHELTYKHLFSITIGFDVVLERRRGRRY